MSRLLAILIVACLLLSFEVVAEGETRLADGYEMRLIYSPPLSGLGKIVVSEYGGIYILHCPEPGHHRVSMVNLEVGVTPIRDLGTDATLVGGPADTFFVAQGTEIIQVGPDGQISRWGERPQALLHWYTSAGTFLGVAGDSVVEVYEDGSFTTLLGGLPADPYDVVEHERGVFVFVMDGSLIHVDTEGEPSVVATLSADNTDLFLDGDGTLYANGGGGRLVTVDRETGELSPVVEPVHFGSIQTPADFVIVAGKAVFASWIACSLTWVDLETGDGGEVIDQDWSNGRSDVGPDDALYLGVASVDERSKIVRFFADGRSEVYVDDIQGRLIDLSFDPGGTLFFSVASDQRRGVFYKPWGQLGTVEVPGSEAFWTTSLSVNPVTEHLMAVLEAEAEGGVMIAEFSRTGLLDTHQVTLPASPTSIELDHGPDGFLYMAAVDRDAFYAGPEVARWIIHIDLASGTGTIVFQKDLEGVCPMIAFSIDHAGNMWWILNPDFVLFRVSPEGDKFLLAENLPIDSGSVGMNSVGQLFLNTPEGIYLIERGGTEIDWTIPVITIVAVSMATLLLLILRRGRRV